MTLRLSTIAIALACAAAAVAACSSGAAAIGPEPAPEVVEWVLHPTAGATYEATPAFHPGLEHWMRAEHLDRGNFGPTALLSFGKVWWSTGPYLRASDATHAMQPGDAFGRIWVRAVVGVELGSAPRVSSR
jgi:hypothetical protein